MTDYSGVLSELVDGTWEEPGTGKRYDIGIKSLVIRDNLEGDEARLVANLHRGKRITVISDPYTHDAMGKRIYSAWTTGERICLANTAMFRHWCCTDT